MTENSERVYLSVGEANEQSPRCICRPTNVLYWELSEADTTGCPIHWVDWVLQSYPEDYQTPEEVREFMRNRGLLV
jgi:hypothetical protein